MQRTGTRIHIHSKHGNTKHRGQLGGVCKKETEDITSDIWDASGSWGYSRALKQNLWLGGLDIIQYSYPLASTEVGSRMPFRHQPLCIDAHVPNGQEVTL